MVLFPSLEVPQMLTAFCRMPLARQLHQRPGQPLHLSTPAQAQEEGVLGVMLVLWSTRQCCSNGHYRTWTEKDAV